MHELEAVRSLLQMGAAGILIIAGAGVLRFLREERADRAEERKDWFARMDQIAEQLRTLTAEVTEALRLAREEAGNRCPFTGASRATVLEFEEHLRRKLKEGW